MKSKILLFALIAAALTGYGRIAAGDEQPDYYAIFIDGKQVGFAERTRTEEADSVVSSENAKITLSRVGSPITVETRQSSTETKDGKPIAFESVQKMSFIETKVTGKIDANGTIYLTESSFGNEQKRSIPWPQGAVMSEGLRLLEKQKGLNSGTSYEVIVFDPSISPARSKQQGLNAKITVGDKQKVDLLGRIVTLTEVRTKINVPPAGEIESIEYVDDQLKMYKSVTPMMGMLLEMIACEKEVATGRVESYELIDKIFVASPQLIADVRLAKSLQYTLSAVKEPNSPSELFKVERKIQLDSIPSTDNQKVEIIDNNHVIVTVSPVDAPTGATFPYKGTDKKILEMLKPARFIQSDNGKIIELAKQATGDTNDAAEAVKRIEAFVANYIESRDLTVGYASALEIVDSKQGDCSEFSVLTAALCRAVGIPARITVGYAYVKEFAGTKGGFGGHAWVEAYVGDKWVGLDAAFKSAGRGGYDAGHIALAYGNGDPEDFFTLMNTFGQFKIDKIKIERK